MANNALEKIISQNKKAFHDYFIDEKYECGIVLTGTETRPLEMVKLIYKIVFVILNMVKFL